MTDLPVIKDEWWLEVHRRAKTGANDADVTNVATLEDVRAVLDAAGYVVVEKGYTVPYYGTLKTMLEGYEKFTKEKTSGTPAAVCAVVEGVMTSRPAEGREEPGTQVLDVEEAYREVNARRVGQFDECDRVRGRQPEQCFVPEFCVPPKMVLEVRFPLGGTPRRAMFSDLHQVEREHWISLLPCSECEGPVNDKICVTCFEDVSAKVEEAKKIASDAIDLIHQSHVFSASALRERLNKL